MSKTGMILLNSWGYFEDYNASKIPDLVGK